MKSPRKRALFGFAAALLLLLAAGLSAQEPGPIPTPAKPPAGTPTKRAATPAQKVGIVVTTEEVVVPVTVKDRNGNLVPGLLKEDFRVFEDNVEQNIKQLKTEAYPLSMVVLIDNDLKQKDAAQVNPSLVSLIGGMALEDEAIVCLFDQFFHEGKGFTKNQDKLVVELQRTDLASRTSVGPVGDPFGGPTLNNAPIPGTEPVNDPTLRAIKGQPTKALDDAVYDAAMLLKDRDSKKRRKIILLISDGQNGAKFNTHSYAETRAELLRQVLPSIA